MRKGATVPDSLQDRLEKRIARKRGDVFLRTDFDDLGGYDQVGRALRQLIEKGRLMKVGYGMYTRARPSILDGAPVPTKGMRELATEALGRLGVQVVPTRFEEAYNAGRSEQVPTGRVVGVRGKRVRRKIGYDGVFLRFEPSGRNRPKPRAKTKQRPTAPISVRAALRLIWQADSYPIRGNEDWRTSSRLMEEALANAGTAVPAPDDAPEFAAWIAVLRNPTLPEIERDDIMSAVYDLFDPERANQKT